MVTPGISGVMRWERAGEEQVVLAQGQCLGCCHLYGSCWDSYLVEMEILATGSREES